MRQINTGVDALVRALIPGHVHRVEVVTSDDFDRNDNSRPPGDYEWIEVTDDAADKWDAGLDACNQRGVPPRSREGVQLRWQISRGVAPMPAELTAWLDRRDEEAAAEAEGQAQAEAYRQHLVGWTDLGSAHARAYERDAMTAPVVAAHGGRILRRLNEMTLVEEVREPGPITGYYLLWSRDPEVVEEAQRRAEITGHRYGTELFAALVSLETDRVTLGNLGGWFGGTFGLTADVPVVSTHGSSASTQTGPEKEDGLRDYLVQLEERHPAEVDRIRRVVGLVVPGSIQALTAGV